MENLIIEALKDANTAREKLLKQMVVEINKLIERADRLERTNVGLIKVIRRREAMIDRLVEAERKEKYLKCE